MEILEKFKKYIAFDTQSSETSLKHPSSDTQIEFGKMLVEDLKKLNVKDIIHTKEGYIYAFIDNKKEKTIGLISHMDTAPAFVGGCKNPKFIEKYDGKDIVLNEKVVMNKDEFPALKEVIGEDLLVTDGNHLLGGDDKAGIVIIFEFLKYYLSHLDEFLYNLAICFTPDEEIGEGPLFFDVNTMKADYAYTLDGGSIYEASFENFNASSCKVTIYGKNVHPGSAKDVMVNSVYIASEYAQMLKDVKRPEDSDDKEGFIFLESISGEVEKTTLYYIIRDFDLNELHKKEELFKKAKEELVKKYPRSAIEIKIKEQYLNMKDVILKDTTVIELINKAYLSMSLPIKYVPTRGGTDGATISYKGLLCPNLGVGDFNAHGKYEFVSVTQMCIMVDIIKALFKSKI